MLFYERTILPCHSTLVRSKSPAPSQVFLYVSGYMFLAREQMDYHYKLAGLTFGGCYIMQALRLPRPLGPNNRWMLPHISVVLYCCRTNLQHSHANVLVKLVRFRVAGTMHGVYS